MKEQIYKILNTFKENPSSIDVCYEEFEDLLSQARSAQTEKLLGEVRELDREITSIISSIFELSSYNSGYVTALKSVKNRLEQRIKGEK